MRHSYTLLLYLMLPLIAWLGWRRSRRFEDHRIAGSWLDRFALNPRPLPQNPIWIHAVSLGETRSILTLTEHLLTQESDTPILITNSSMSGALQVRQHFGDRVYQRMLPYDYPFAIKRILRRVQPKQLIIVETDIWPNLFHYAHRFNIPLLLVNACLKQHSLERYQRPFIRTLMLQTLANVQTIAVQSEMDYQAFITLGVPKEQLNIMGNLKFDLSLPPTLKTEAKQWTQQYAENRFIWTAGSTHQGEDQQLTNIQKSLSQHPANPLLILAPRQLDEIPALKQYLNDQSISFQCRSELDKEPLKATTQLLIVDAYGELPFWYAVSHLSVIGGSFTPFGGHSFIEAAWLNKPVFSGPHIQNLINLYTPAIQNRAVTLVDNADELQQYLQMGMDQPESLKASADRAYQYVQKNTGANQSLLNLISTHLAKTPCDQHN